MSEDLTREWVESKRTILRESEHVGEATGVHLVLQQVITGAPEGDLAYHLIVSDGETRIEHGVADNPDVTIQQDHGTAVAIAGGELSPHAALLAGRLRLTGDVALLVTHQGALRRLLEAVSDASS